MTYAGLNAIVVGVTNTDNDGVGGVSEVLTGTYVGNGADNRPITGLGFTARSRDRQGDYLPNRQLRVRRR